MATKLQFHMLSFLTEVTSWHCPFNIYQHSKYMGKSSRIFWLMSEAYSKPCYTSNMIHFAKIVNSFQLSVVNCLRKKLYLRSLKGINLWMIFAEAFYKKSVLRNFSKFTGKHLCQSLFPNKIADLRPAFLWKKRLWQRHFPVNLEAATRGVL